MKQEELKIKVNVIPPNEISEYNVSGELLNMANLAIQVMCLNKAYVLGQFYTPLSNHIYLFGNQWGTSNECKISITNTFRWSESFFYKIWEECKDFIYNDITEDEEFVSFKSIGDGFELVYLAEKFISYGINKKPKKEKKFVYLMIDKNTNYTKIGLANNPKYRERTLQSEKPTIELLYKFIGTWDNEKFLHDHFKKKRIRGEWFNLNNEDIEFVKSYFESAKIN